MAWHYKSPLAFPASYLAAIRRAANQLNEPVMLGGFTDIKKANALQEKFRWLKWCIRQEPSTVHDLSTIILNYDLRTYIQDDGVLGMILWLVVKPTKISEFALLNPELAKEVLSELND